MWQLPAAAALQSKWGKEIIVVRDIGAWKAIDQISKCIKDNEVQGENEIELHGDGLQLEVLV